MGLMLSILVVCVGVIEALSCFEHFQNGVLNGATNFYENIRRDSTFFNYTSKKLKSFYEGDNKTKRFPLASFASLDETTNVEECAGTSVDKTEQLGRKKEIVFERKPVKKLEKADKINIVKRMLEKQKKPKVARSFSMPELEYTKEDLELTKIINELAIEPIVEVNLDNEIDDVDSEVITKEFDNLFNETVNPKDKSIHFEEGVSKRFTHNLIGSEAATIDSDQIAAVQPSKSAATNENRDSEKDIRKINDFAVVDEEIIIKSVAPKECNANLSLASKSDIESLNVKRDRKEPIIRGNLPRSTEIIFELDNSRSVDLSKITSPRSKLIDSDISSIDEIVDDDTLNRKSNLKNFADETASPPSSSNERSDVVSFNKLLTDEVVLPEESLKEDSESVELPEYDNEDDTISADEMFEKLYTDLEKDITPINLNEKSQKTTEIINDRFSATEEPKQDKFVSNNEMELFENQIVNLDESILRRIKNLADEMVSHCFEEVKKSLPNMPTKNYSPATSPSDIKIDFSDQGKTNYEEPKCIYQNNKVDNEENDGLLLANNETKQSSLDNLMANSEIDLDLKEICLDIGIDVAGDDVKEQNEKSLLGECNLSEETEVEKAFESKLKDEKLECESRRDELEKRASYEIAPDVSMEQSKCTDLKMEEKSPIEAEEKVKLFDDHPVIVQMTDTTIIPGEECLFFKGDAIVEAAALDNKSDLTVNIQSPSKASDKSMENANLESRSNENIDAPLEFDKNESSTELSSNKESLELNFEVKNLIAKPLEPECIKKNEPEKVKSEIQNTDSQKKEINAEVFVEPMLEEENNSTDNSDAEIERPELDAPKSGETIDIVEKLNDNAISVASEGNFENVLDEFEESSESSAEAVVDESEKSAKGTAVTAPEPFWVS